MAFMYYDFTPGPRPNALEHYAWQMKLEPSSFHHITWWTTRLLLLRRFNQPSLGNAVVVHVVGGNSLWQMAKSLEFFLWLHASAASQIYTQCRLKRSVIFLRAATTSRSIYSPNTWWMMSPEFGDNLRKVYHLCRNGVGDTDTIMQRVFLRA